MDLQGDERSFGWLHGESDLLRSTSQTGQVGGVLGDGEGEGGVLSSSFQSPPPFGRSTSGEMGTFDPLFPLSPPSEFGMECMATEGDIGQPWEGSLEGWLPPGWNMNSSKDPEGGGGALSPPGGFEEMDDREGNGGPFLEEAEGMGNRTLGMCCIQEQPGFVGECVHRQGKRPHVLVTDCEGPPGEDGGRSPPMPHMTPDEFEVVEKRPKTRLEREGEEDLIDEEDEGKTAPPDSRAITSSDSAHVQPSGRGFICQPHPLAASSSSHFLPLPCTRNDTLLRGSRSTSASDVGGQGSLLVSSATSLSLVRREGGADPLAEEGGEGKGAFLPVPPGYSAMAARGSLSASPAGVRRARESESGTGRPSRLNLNNSGSSWNSATALPHPPFPFTSTPVSPELGSASAHLPTAAGGRGASSRLLDPSLGFLRVVPERDVVGFRVPLCAHPGLLEADVSEMDPDAVVLPSAPPSFEITNDSASDRDEDMGMGGGDGHAQGHGHGGAAHIGAAGAAAGSESRVCDDEPPVSFSVPPPEPSSSSRGASAVALGDHLAAAEGNAGTLGEGACTQSDLDVEVMDGDADLPEVEDSLESLNSLDDVPQHLREKLPAYKERISFSLGEGGRELLRKAIKMTGYKGHTVHSTSLQQLLKVAAESGVWKCALRLHLEHRKEIPMSASHMAFRTYKARLSLARREKKRKGDKKMAVVRSADGLRATIPFYEGIALQMGCEGRRALLRRLREQSGLLGDRLEAHLKVHGLSIKETRDATLPQIFRLAYYSGCWEYAVQLFLKHQKDKKISRLSAMEEKQGPVPVETVGAFASLELSRDQFHHYALQPDFQKQRRRASKIDLGVSESSHHLWGDGTAAAAAHHHPESRGACKSDHSTDMKTTHTSSTGNQLPLRSDPANVHTDPTTGISFKDNGSFVYTVGIPKTSPPGGTPFSETFAVLNEQTSAWRQRVDKGELPGSQMARVAVPGDVCAPSAPSIGLGAVILPSCDEILQAAKQRGIEKHHRHRSSHHGHSRHSHSQRGTAKGGETGGSSSSGESGKRPRQHHEAPGVSAESERQKKKQVFSCPLPPPPPSKRPPPLFQDRQTSLNQDETAQEKPKRNMMEFSQNSSRNPNNTNTGTSVETHRDAADIPSVPLPRSSQNLPSASSSSASSVPPPFPFSTTPPLPSRIFTTAVNRQPNAQPHTPTQEETINRAAPASVSSPMSVSSQEVQQRPKLPLQSARKEGEAPHARTRAPANPPLPAPAFARQHSGEGPASQPPIPMQRPALEGIGGASFGATVAPVSVRLCTARARPLH
uniref:Uncharacterized protein n=1 Tax=Chromera velia CCMP2878 TaxID=1169474 RepID=A0A0G4H9Y6_9ALVE|eukprot:Cvel_25555.t1-p1 / transcript=Cvel_25555.t1 / gene=Cvel_25555 / organism=Chromera_velia_CCMP2878 / gene_product=hypothetical protein / transcript_product=hypothetical protein / location=Cvel_scaffold2911:117-6867(-) / protein_length=1298 / sequence_SO=supercontig / SO=protein_coding / is_pseudo=false